MKRRWSGYHIICDECGDKYCLYSVDIIKGEDVDKRMNDTWDRMIKEVLIENHGNHSFKFISKIIDCPTKKELLNKLKLNDEN